MTAARRFVCALFVVVLGSTTVLAAVDGRYHARVRLTYQDRRIFELDQTIDRSTFESLWLLGDEATTDPLVAAARQALGRHLGYTDMLPVDEAAKMVDAQVAEIVVKDDVRNREKVVRRLRPTRRAQVAARPVRR